MRRSVTAARIAGLFLLGAVCSAESCPSDIGDGDQPEESIILVNRNGQGEQATGPGAGGSLRPSPNEFGDLVAFDSDATNLAADGNGKRDVFVRDRTRTVGSTVFASLSNGGLQGTEDSKNASMSADGNAVAFEALSRMATGPTPILPGGELIYVRTLFAGPTRPVVTLAALPGPPGINDPPGYLRNPSLSGDGRYVAFESNVSDLHLPVPYTWSPITQVYVADLQPATPLITLISHVPGNVNQGGGNNSLRPRISRDGSIVAFESDAADLDGATGRRQIFVGFTGGADCEMVSLIGAATPAALDAVSASISYDGNLVAFATDDPAFAPSPCIAVRNRSGNSTQVLSQIGVNDFVDSPFAPQLAGNGTAAVFLGSQNSTLAGGGGLVQVWAWTQNGGVRMVSTHLTGNPSDAACDWPAISGDGLWAFFSTVGANLVVSDLNGQSDIFTRGRLR